MEREQFTFYKSFAEALRIIRKPADRCAAYDALVNYALYGTLPDLDRLPDSAVLFFNMAKPNLDSSRRKAESGRRGGKANANDEQSESERKAEADEEQTGSKPEANRKQTAREKENEKEGEKEVEGEKENEKENECSLSPTPSSPPLTAKQREALIQEALNFHGEELLETVRDWVKYKIEKRQGYKETGFKSLLTQIDRHASEYGDAAMVDIIRQSMSSNYQGILFDRLKGRPAQRGYGSVEAWLNGSP